MNDVFNELDKIKILDKDNILTFKNYINKKYPKNPPTENAKILSETINKIIYTNLEGLPDDLKLPIKNDIIKNTLSKGKVSITLCDIFQTCIGSENIGKDFTQELINWIDLKITIQTSKEHLYDYLESNGFKIVNSTNQPEDLLYHEDNFIIEDNTADLSTNENAKSKGFVFNYLSDFKNFKKIGYLILVAIIIIPLCNINKVSCFNKKTNQEKRIVKSGKKEFISTKYPNLHIPKYMRYTEINKEKLRTFLEKKNSLLSKEPYFSTILSVSKEFNLNPIVLFSITGQEQSFVPRSNSNAYKIANNPFNVFHSWKEYNTDINDTARIASRTVINLSKNRPENKDPFEWIGRKYAEDKNWGKGVKSIFENLTKQVNEAVSKS
ncbi:hypothetical protein [Clostridium brassicae]|uniref:Mannosyl-glycoprotein endo-beta-N-acetylglucosamidase-like domain-containing protein n=1 Tax=Clostridium brassicae TaxID=2999072 RepID=A0ABT4DCZ5_9CLOT|nr:hypothetical protein [Clostridium brassicae]MCY6960178.1 hypothetical protein [Clostridium brassicae]